VVGVTIVEIESNGIADTGGNRSSGERAVTGGGGNESRGEQATVWQIVVGATGVVGRKPR